MRGSSKVSVRPAMRAVGKLVNLYFCIGQTDRKNNYDEMNNIGYELGKARI